MKTKHVTQLADGYFVGVALADESPLEPGVFLMPGNTVDAEPPTVPQGHRAKWNGAGFDMEAVPAPEPQPMPEPPSRADEIRGRLFQIDADSIRPLRAIEGGTASDFDRAKLAVLDTEAATLRAELAGLA